MAHFISEAYVRARSPDQHKCHSLRAWCSLAHEQRLRYLMTHFIPCVRQ